MGLFKRINQGLKKTRENMSVAIDSMFHGKTEIDDEFYEDLEEKVLYIFDVLHNPKAAKELLDAVENAIIERLPFCESFERF